MDQPESIPEGAELHLSCRLIKTLSVQSQVHGYYLQLCIQSILWHDSQDQIMPDDVQHWQGQGKGSLDSSPEGINLSIMALLLPTMPLMSMHLMHCLKIGT